MKECLLRKPKNMDSVTKEKNAVREFKRSVCFKAMEQAVLIGEDLKDREETLEGYEGSWFKKVELDSDEGASTCRNFLVCLERLIEILEIKPVNKDYRSKFSKAYKVLYSQ
jgi:hypothetical protein